MPDIPNVWKYDMDEQLLEHCVRNWRIRCHGSDSLSIYVPSVNEQLLVPIALLEMMLKACNGQETKP